MRVRGVRASESVAACLVATAIVLVAAGVFAQDNRIDVVTPFAPELASYGSHSIGVRTVQVTDRNRVDIVNTKEGGPIARYDRTLTLEVWYPARLARRPAARRRVPGRDARARRSPRRSTARRSATRRRSRPTGAFPARHRVARLSGQPLPHEPPLREPREQGLRRGRDRSQGEHLRRPADVREHALQPSVRSAVRAERDCPPGQARHRQLPRRHRRRLRTPGSSATRWVATGWSTSSAAATARRASPAAARRPTACSPSGPPRIPTTARQWTNASRRRSRSRRGGCRPASGMPTA